MLVLEAVTRVVQFADTTSKKERRASMPSYFEMAKKTWLASNKLDGFDDFELKEGFDHHKVRSIIEPFLEQKYFQAHDAAKSSKVSHHICQFICLTVLTCTYMYQHVMHYYY
jgi:hypothetical protein